MKAKKPTESRKEQILRLHESGITRVAEIAMLTGARPSYVASVLQTAGKLHGYFDLYTGSEEPMNVYSRYFEKKLGYRDVETARASVEHLEKMYREFERLKDRAGQHHALSMALTMCDRARFSDKRAEAAIFREWLVTTLERDAKSAAPIESAPTLRRVS